MINDPKKWEDKLFKIEPPVDPCAKLETDNVQLKKLLETAGKEHKKLQDELKKKKVAFEELNVEFGRMVVTMNKQDDKIEELQDKVKSKIVYIGSLDEQIKVLDEKIKGLDGLDEKLKDSENLLKICRNSKLQDAKVGELISVLIGKLFNR